MRDTVDAVLARCGGAASRARLLAELTRNQLDDEVARGHLVAVFPRSYARPWDAELEEVRQVAALASVGGEAGLSHVTGLVVYGLASPRGEAIHVTTSVRRHPQCAATDLVVHRTRLRTPLRRVGTATVVAPEVAVVTSWPLLPVTERPGPAIEAVRRGLVTPARLFEALVPRHGLAGRAAQLRLVERLVAGCESPLELWGLTSVFDIAGLDHGVPQFEVATSRGRFRLDLAFPAQRVAVEMDGHRFHFTREQRERDMQRDAVLAAAGWIVIRLSHHRLHTDVAGCRRDVLAVLASRSRAA